MIFLEIGRIVETITMMMTVRLRKLQRGGIIIKDRSVSNVKILRLLCLIFKEWVWVACFYMSAKLKVASLLARKTGDMSAWHTTLDEVRARLFRYENTMHKSDWSSLPELTNRDGKPCPHSCPAQVLHPV